MKVKKQSPPFYENSQPPFSPRS